MKRILSVLTAVFATATMVFAQEAPTTWSEVANTAWYGNGSASEYAITTAEDLAGLATLVNEGNTFEGKTITLAADIDLASKTWTPIGTSSKPFNGTFDGAEKTISNLKIDASEKTHQGLFGKIGTPEKAPLIQNVTLKNVAVTGANYTGALVGQGYVGTIQNCHVSGTIAITGRRYVGGISGAGYATISNCSVIADKAGTVTAASDQWNAGGIIGFLCEGGAKATTVEGCVVKNMTIRCDDGGVGGISGNAHYGTVLKDNTIENVTVIAVNPEYPGYAGLIAGETDRVDGKATAYLINNTVTNSTAEESNGTAITYQAPAQANIVIGTNIVFDTETFTAGTSKIVSGTFECEPPAGLIASGSVSFENADGTTTVKVPDPCATINNDPEEMSLAAAFAAAKNGDTITLTKDVALPYWTSVSNVAGFTFDGAGCTISDLRQPLFSTASGAVTIKDLSVIDSNIEGVSAQGNNCGTVFVAWLNEAAQITIDNCHVKNVSITAEKYIGVFAGYISGGHSAKVVLTGCSVDTINLVANEGSVGAFVGHACDEFYAYKCTLSGTNTISAAEIEGDEARLDKVGALVGRVNNGAVYLDVTDTSKTTVKHVDTEVSAIVGDMIGDASTLELMNGVYTVDPMVQAFDRSKDGLVATVDGQIVKVSKKYEVHKAKASSKTYRTLAAALAAKGDVTLLGNVIEDVTVSATENLEIPAEKNFVGTITVTAKGALTITGEGAIDGTLVVEKGATVIKPETLTLAAPTGYYWADDTTLTAHVAKIGENYYPTLAAAVAAVTKDAFDIELLQDASGDGIVIKKPMNINFGGFTYTITSAVGSSNTGSNGFQILRAAQNVTLSNGALVADSLAIQTLVINYANLSLVKMNLDATEGTNSIDEDDYTLSNNSGSITLAGGTKIVANGGVAFDVYRHPDYASPQVTVKDATIEGEIEVSGGTQYKPYEALRIEGGDFSKATLDVQNGSIITKVEEVDFPAPAGSMWWNETLLPVAAKIGKALYPTLVDAVAAAAPKAKIELVASVSGEGIFITQPVTIDFAGYTYTVTGPAVGSTGTQTQAFHIEAFDEDKNAYDVTLKNGEILVECTAVKMVIQNYSNLTLDNMVVDASKGTNGLCEEGKPLTRYTLSNNNGNTVLKNGTKIVAKDDDCIAFDVCYNTSYPKGTSVTIADKTVVIEGQVEYGPTTTDVAKAHLSLVVPAAMDLDIIGHGDTLTWKTSGKTRELVSYIGSNLDTYRAEADLEIALQDRLQVEEEGTTVTIEDLPAGLEWITDTYKIAGVPSEKDVGTHMLIFTTTLADGCSFESLYMLTIDHALPHYTVTIEADAEAGTVTGAGDYPAGTVVTLTAKANKDYIFTGWEDVTFADESTDPRATKVQIVVPEYDITVKASFAKKGAEGEEDDIITADDVKVSGVATEGYILNTTPVSIKIDVDSASMPTIKVSKLPSGLKFNKKTNTIEGTPKKVGLYDLVISVSNASKKNQQIVIEDAILVLGRSGIPAPQGSEVATLKVAADGSIEGLATLPEGCTISGLPAGMKWVDGKLVGYPKKPGNYVVTVTTPMKDAITDLILNIESYMTAHVWGFSAEDGNPYELTLAIGEKTSLAGFESNFVVKYNGDSDDANPLFVDAENYTVKAKGLPSGISLKKSKQYYTLAGTAKVKKGAATTYLPTFTITHKVSGATATTAEGDVIITLEEVDPVDTPIWSALELDDGTPAALKIDAKSATVMLGAAPAVTIPVLTTEFDPYNPGLVCRIYMKTIKGERHTVLFVSGVVAIYSIDGDEIIFDEFEDQMGTGAKETFEVAFEDEEEDKFTFSLEGSITVSKNGAVTFKGAYTVEAKPGCEGHPDVVGAQEYSKKTKVTGIGFTYENEDGDFAAAMLLTVKHGSKLVDAFGVDVTLEEGEDEIPEEEDNAGFI